MVIYKIIDVYLLREVYEYFNLKFYGNLMKLIDVYLLREVYE
jgi:hypothetical protein